MGNLHLCSQGCLSLPDVTFHGSLSTWPQLVLTGDGDGDGATAFSFLPARPSLSFSFLGTMQGKRQKGGRVFPQIPSHKPGLGAPPWHWLLLECWGFCDYTWSHSL